MPWRTSRRADSADDPTPKGSARQRSRSLWLLVPPLALAPAPPGRAEPEGADPPPIHALGPVTITAARSERGALEVPGNVTVIDRPRIERSGARSVEELLRQEAGLFVTNTTTSPAGTSVEARGFNNGGAAGSNLLVLVDGRRANQADTGTMDWAVVPLGDVERIEIVRGPASALYGDNAVGGVVHVITRGPDGPPLTELHGAAGSYDTGAGSLFARRAIGPVSASAFASGITSDGYRERSGYDAVSFRGRLSTEFGDRLAVGLQGGYHEDERDFPGALLASELGLGRKSASPRAADDSSDVDTFHLQLPVDALLAEDVELRFQPFHRGRRDRATITSVEPTVGATTIDFDKGSTGFDAQVRVDRPLGRFRNRLIVGSEFLYEDTDRTIVSMFGRLESRNERHVVAAFAQDEIHLTDRLILAGGARFDYANYRLQAADDDAMAPAQDTARPDFSIWSPRASLTWRPWDPLSVYASYAEGFRLPNFDEGAPIVFGGSALIPDLDEQESRAYEVGAKYYDERVSSNLALYWMDVDDELVFNPVTFENQNFDRVRHRGVEFSLSARPCDGLELSGSYTFADVEIRRHDDPTFEGERMPITPRHRGSLGALLRLPAGFEVGAQANFVGKRRLANDFTSAAPKLDDYATLDLRLAWRPPLEDWTPVDWLDLELRFAVRNATDEKYNDFGALSSFAGPGFNPAPTRSVDGGFQITVRR